MASRVVVAIDEGGYQVFESADLIEGNVHQVDGIVLTVLKDAGLVPNCYSSLTTAELCLGGKILSRHRSRKIFASLHTREIELANGCSVRCHVSHSFGGSVVVYGRTQSGKTFESCAEICRSIRDYKCPCLFFVRALKGERSSQTAALTKFVHDIDDEIDVVEVTSKSNRDTFRTLQEAIRTDNTNGMKTLFVLMANNTTLANATNHLRDNDRLRYLVALDEADIYMKGKSHVDSKTWTAIKPILDGALERYYITATPLDVLGLFDAQETPRVVLTKFALADEIDGEDIYYRSLHSAERRDLPIPTNSVEDAIANGQQILEECFHDGLHNEYHDLGLPMFFLHFHSERVIPNGRIAEEMSRQLYGDDEIISLTFDNEGGSSFGSKVSIYREGEVINQEFNDISKAVSWILSLGIRVLYFMGGKTCSRAFRVTCADHRTYPSVMIYNYNDNCGDGALLDQRMGRMNGITDTSLRCRQYIYSSEQNLNRALDVVDASSEIVNGWTATGRVSFETIVEQVKRPPRYSRRSLSRTRTENTFAIDPEITSIHSTEHNIIERSVEDTAQRPEVTDRQRGQAKLLRRLQSLLESVGIHQGDMSGYRAWRLADGDRGHARLYRLLEERHPGWESDAKTHYPGGVKNGVRVWMQRYGIIPASQ